MKTKIHTRLIRIILLITFVLIDWSWANDYAVKLYKQAATKNGNVIVSPFGTSSAFAIAFMGAKGRTSDEITNVFNFYIGENQFDSTMKLALKSVEEISADGRVQLLCAASLWSSKMYKLDSTFLKKTQTLFKSEAMSVDFTNKSEACNMINKWASLKTKGKFSSIITPSAISPITNVIITSAVYFKGNWAKKFMKKSTTDKQFYISRTDSIQVPTMHQVDYFEYWQNDNVQVLQMKYLDNRVSMVIVLPCVIDGLSSIEKTLTMDSISSWTNGLSSTKVKVFFPRFKFSNKTNMKKNIQALGIESAFDYKKADFSGITGKQDFLFIEKVLQQAVIEVNEEGTEASSVDAILAGIGGLGPKLPPPIPVFRADHPFLFLIKENVTGTMLFIGRVINPLIN
jgi:serpin B